MKIINLTIVPVLLFATPHAADKNRRLSPIPCLYVTILTDSIR